MQNLVVLMNPFEYDMNTSSKGGNMCLNLFCINEDAAFELSEIRYFEVEKESIGKGYLYLH